jgi:hypothetical protein
MFFLNRVKKIFQLKNDGPRKIIARSNIIQYDDMGYPLRLCIMDDGKQIWLDSYNEETDLVCEWKFVGDE